MSIVNRTTLKGYFETGDTPTQAQFADLIDSCFNLAEDNTVVNGSKIIDGDNTDSYIQIGDSGEKVIRAIAGASSLDLSEVSGYELQADGSNGMGQAPGGGWTVGDQNSIVMDAPVISTDNGDLGVLAGNLTIQDAGKGLSLSASANSPIGTSALVGGTKTVANTFIKAGAIVVPIWTGTGNLTGSLKQGTIVAGTSFIIASSIGTDTAQFRYVIINPS